MNRYLDHNAKNCYNNKTDEFMDDDNFEGFLYS